MCVEFCYKDMRHGTDTPRWSYNRFYIPLPIQSVNKKSSSVTSFLCRFKLALELAYELNHLKINRHPSSLLPLEMDACFYAYLITRVSPNRQQHISGHLLQIFLYKGHHVMHIAVKLSTATFIHKAGKFCMQCPEVLAEHPASWECLAFLLSSTLH